MIFKSVLKYKIFEWCLDTLFDKITNNFTNKSPTILNIPKIGEYFSKVEDCDEDDSYSLTYLDCIITEYVIYDALEEIPVNVIPENTTIDNIGIGFS